MDIWGEGGVITKSDSFFGGEGGAFLNILGLLKVKIQNGRMRFFLDSKISNIFGYA